MLKADKLNVLNGSPSFGVTKYADRTDKGYKNNFVLFSFLIFTWQRSKFSLAARTTESLFLRSTNWLKFRNRRAKFVVRWESRKSKLLLVHFLQQLTGLLKVLLLPLRYNFCGKFRPKISLKFLFAEPRPVRILLGSLGCWGGWISVDIEWKYALGVFRAAGHFLHVLHSRLRRRRHCLRYSKCDSL